MNKTIINNLTISVKLLKEKEIKLEELEKIIYYNNFEYYVNNDKKLLKIFKTGKKLKRLPVIFSLEQVKFLT